MSKHLNDTVNCVASGKEQHVTVVKVYEMLQKKNQRYRWKYAFQFPSILQTLPNRSHCLKTNLNEKAEFDAWIKMDCAKTAMKLKKYIATFEENSIKMIENVELEKTRLHKQNAGHSTNDNLIDRTASVKQQFTDQLMYEFIVPPKNTNNQEFTTACHDQCYNQSWLSSISSNSSIDKSIIIQD
ncbi:Serine/threonine-protein kinase [Dirofilaria immitis]